MPLLYQGSPLFNPMIAAQQAATAAAATVAQLPHQGVKFLVSCVQVLEALLKAGADVFRKDADDWMALHFAGAAAAGLMLHLGCSELA
jgi:hypothetical protein